MAKSRPDEQPAVHYDCKNCLAFCCSVYDVVEVTDRDLRRLARHFQVSVETAARRYTVLRGGTRVLRRKEDTLFESACRFLDPDTRGCSIYAARPGVCRDYPGRSRCSYYDLLEFERQSQGDNTVVPLVQIRFSRRAAPTRRSA